VEGVEKSATGYRVRASTKGQEIEVEADLAVHAAGRAPAFDDLDLDAAGIEHANGRLNEYLQSVSKPAVYAAGDAAQMGPPLTPVSSHDEDRRGRSAGG
jgi:glutathione reductase (NADPH)